MASNTFVVNNDAAVAKTFTLQSQDMKEAKYIDTASSLSVPTFATISHQIVPQGRSGIDRHLVKFGISAVDVEGKTFTVTASCQLSIPRSTAITDTIIKDVTAFMRNYMTSAYALLLSDGITP